MELGPRAESRAGRGHGTIGAGVLWYRQEHLVLVDGNNFTGQPRSMSGEIGMSQKAKRVWTAGAVGVAVLAVAVAGLLIWQVHLRAATAEEGGGAAPLDPATYRGVSELRSRVRLSDATLAAMGCSQTTVETILARAVHEDVPSSWIARPSGFDCGPSALRSGPAVSKVRSTASKPGGKHLLPSRHIVHGGWAFMNDVGWEIGDVNRLVRR